MSPIAKLIMYAGLAALVGILGYCFGVEHSEVLAGHVNASRSRMMGYLGGFFASLIVMGLRLAYDLSQFLGERAENSFLEGDAPLPEAQDLVEAAQLHGK